MSKRQQRDDRPAKRSSSRTVVVSKAMRYVDEVTRLEVKDKRLESLEADNYNVEKDVDADDDAYIDSDNEKPTLKRSKKGNKSKSKCSIAEKWASRKHPSLSRVLEISSTDMLPNYYSINASLSIYPPRHFCSVCGYLGSYSCTRCGMRFCSVFCNDNHKETRCLNVSLI